jgi:Transmembrane amino acid transporter protein
MLNSIANMANSILGAGTYPLPLAPCPWLMLAPSSLSSRDHRYVIRSYCDFLSVLSVSSGLPYAMSRAGFFTGILLLVVLSAVTDWTIRLIVTNAKLSGTKSYIGIMDRCFGSSGRAAVSFFQFSFAFGGAYVFRNTLHKPSHPMIGMCAFGIIIGASVLYLGIIPMPMSAFRGYDPARHPLRISRPSFHTRPLSLCRPSIHHRFHHYLRFLPAIIVSRHPQTLHRVQLCALRDDHHRSFSHVRRPPRISTPQRRSI